MEIVKGTTLFLRQQSKLCKTIASNMRLIILKINIHEGIVRKDIQIKAYFVGREILMGCMEVFHNEMHGFPSFSVPYFDIHVDGKRTKSKTNLYTRVLMQMKWILNAN